MVTMPRNIEGTLIISNRMTTKRNVSYLHEEVVISLLCSESWICRYLLRSSGLTKRVSPVVSLYDPFEIGITDFSAFICSFNG